MITINGKDHPLAQSTPLEDLLKDLGFGDKPVVVELNREALSPSEFAQRTIKEGDALEIITIAAGG